MPGTFIQSAIAQTTVNGTGQNLTIGPLTVTLGNQLILWLVCNDATSAALSAGGNTLLNAGIESPAFGGSNIFGYYCNITTGGAISVTRTGGDILAGYLAEYSGLNASGSLAGAFTTNPQAGGPGTGTDAVTSGAVSVTAPCMQFGMTSDSGGTSNPNSASNTGTISAGTGWTNRGNWVDSAAVAVSRFEELRSTSSGSHAATFTLTGNKQFADLHSASFALPEAITSTTITPNAGALAMSGNATADSTNFKIVTQTAISI